MSDTSRPVLTLNRKPKAEPEKVKKPQYSRCSAENSG